MTVGLTTYSSDERFSALHLDESEVILIISVLAGSDGNSLFMNGFDLISFG